MSNRIKKTQKLLQLLKVKDHLNPHGEFSKVPLTYIKNMYGLKNDAFVRKCLKEARITSWDDLVDLDNAIVVVDEVHNLFRPLATQKADHNYLESHFINTRHHELKGFKDHNYKHDRMKIIIMSATPGDNPRDVLKLLNIVRNPTRPPLKEFNVDKADEINNFKRDLAGLVSYFDMSSDPGKFPIKIDLGITRYPMSNKQFVKYIEAYKENMKQPSATNYEKLAKENKLSKYWNKSRKYSNMVYNIEPGMQLGEVSSKLPPLLSNIEKHPNDKHYVYSSFYENKGTSQGILEIERQLKANGYEKLTIQEAKLINKGKDIKPQKRYIMATLREIGDSKNAGQNLNEMIKVYNMEANKDGSLVHVMLASNAFNEGIDLKAVRHIHMFEPLLTMASEQQTIGRARRYCSHADLDYEKWKVYIHRYFSDLPIKVGVDNTKAMKEEVSKLEFKLKDLEEEQKNANKGSKGVLKSAITSVKKELTSLKKELKELEKLNASEIKNIDDFIYNEAFSRFKSLHVIYNCMREAAVDCKLLEKFHNDPNIRCGI